MSKIYLNTIYRATEGEGVHIGTPQIFVRLQGCHVGCINCDSKETWAFPAHSLVSLDTVEERVLSLARLSRPGLRRVSITGGEPLHPRNREGLLALIQCLKEKHNFYLNLETSGVIYDEEIFSLVDFVSLDYKTLSTHVSKHIKDHNLSCQVIRQTVEKAKALQVKSVISDEEDFFEVLRLKQQFLEEGLEFTWCLTPAYNNTEAFPAGRFQKILHLNELNGGLFRFIGQQHKWMFGPDIKDV